VRELEQLWGIDNLIFDIKFNSTLHNCSHLLKVSTAASFKELIKK